MEVVKRARRQMKLFSSVDATAFASLLVVILFVVMFADPMGGIIDRGVSTDLPQVSNPVAMRGALRDDAMKVTILRDGQVYFGADRIWSDNLTQEIVDRLKDRGVERKVYIVADIRARWSSVKSVLDGAGAAPGGQPGLLSPHRTFQDEPV